MSATAARRVGSTLGWPAWRATTQSGSPLGQGGLLLGQGLLAWWARVLEVTPHSTLLTGKEGERERETRRGALTAFAVTSLSTMDPLPRRRKEGGGEIVEVYGFAGWIASLVAYGEL